MTDEAAESRGPATTGARPSAPSPSASARPADEEPTAAVPVEEPAAAVPAEVPTATVPTAAVPAEEPTAAVPAEEPAAAVPAEEPTAALPVEEPAPTLPAEEPVPRGVPPTLHDMPPAYTPPAADAPIADEPLPPPGASSPPPPPSGGPTSGDSTPSGGATPPPGAGDLPPGAPPWFGSADGPNFSREKLVRPAEGRYIAGVCAALGRATNTDPVLWRVLLGVLSFFSGVGVLIYLIGWLMIPGEGDAVSPIESLLGRGRSAMQPISVLLLGAAAALTFVLVVHGGFRATLAAVAVVAGAALLIKRRDWLGFKAGGSAAGEPAAFPFGPGGPQPPRPETAYAAPGAPTAAAAGGTATTTAPAGEPVSDLPPAAPEFGAPGYSPPQFSQPTGGYRPPFAPHGPWAGSPQPPYAPPPVPRPPRPPKPPKERSKLGRITFFAVLLVVGALALVDVAGAGVPISAYFAGALATIAVGLIVGAWLGRARGLIFLAVLATFGLAVSSGAERWGGEVGANDFRPRTVDAIADRYDISLGGTTLDLRAVDFAGAVQDTTIAMKYGQVKVLLPDNVDTTATVQLNDGRAQVFGRNWKGKDIGSQTVSDLGPDGVGGGTLRLTIEMNTGNVEVTR